MVVIDTGVQEVAASYILLGGCGIGGGECGSPRRLTAQNPHRRFDEAVKQRIDVGQGKSQHQRIDRRYRGIEFETLGRTLASIGKLETRSGEQDVLEEIGRASCRERVCQYV